MTRSTQTVAYVVMRTDLASLNPGKAMAQAHHAFGAMKHAARSHLPMQAKYIAWQQQADQDFGTTVVLAGTEHSITAALEDAHLSKLPILYGWVFDPTYPLKDGDVTHVLPLNTCAFFFGPKDVCARVLWRFELHE